MLSLPGNVAGISSAAFRPDGRELATASLDGQGLVWWAAPDTGLTIATGAGLDLTAAADSGARIWAGILRPGRSTLQAWTVAARPAGGFSTAATPFPYAVAFSGDGRVGALVDSQQFIVVRDLVRNRTISSIAGEGAVFQVALDRTGRRLAFSTLDGGFHLFRVSSRPTFVATGALTSAGCGSDTTGFAAFSGDGRRVAAVDYCGGGALWDARTGKELQRFETGAQIVSAISLDAHGQRLAVSSFDRTTVVYDLAAHRTVYVLRGDTAPILDVAFNPHGTWVATASHDHDVRVWSTANGQLLRILHDDSDVTSVAFTADGTKVITTAATA